jgi:palmitoyltransferase
MQLWSFVQCIITDPGKVPPFWNNASDSAQLRYCVPCSHYKPERTHHCSACNRCVLNMDHHCPWVNNCIGFQNRKHFVLLIFYILVCCFYFQLTMVLDVFMSLKWQISSFKRTGV